MEQKDNMCRKKEAQIVSGKREALGKFRGQRTCRNRRKWKGRHNRQIYKAVGK